MVELLRRLLNEMQDLEGWKIIEIENESQELFFVKKKLDMNRGVEVHKYAVTVYVAFEEDGEPYLGQSQTEVAASMTEEEIKRILEDVKTGACFVKNKYYSLPEASHEVPVQRETIFGTQSLSHWMPKLAKAIYKNDTQEGGGINSAELFLKKKVRRVVTSKGIDVNFSGYEALVEVIADWNDGKEPVEVFYMANFGDYQPDNLSDKVGTLIESSKERAHAEPTPTLKDINVILSGEAVKELLEYYVVKSSARLKYENISQFEVGQKLQGDVVEGDLLNVQLLPHLDGSSKSAPYDADGFLLKPIQLIDNGVLQTLVGNSQYASYVGIEPTGQLSNMRFGLGEKSIKELKQEPYIELVSFSAFQMNFLTGDFGGEMRLARYFDGEKVQAVSGGALSANINDVQSNMIFSSEEVQHDQYVGPKHILFKGLEIAGA